MKKNLFLLLVILFNFLQGFSQNKSMVSISMGPSFAVGNFANKNPNNSTSGIATTGVVFDIHFTHLLNENLGIAAILRGQSNATDAKAIEDEMKKMYPQVQWSVQSNYWGIGGLLFGGFGTWPLYNKCSFDAKFLIGIANATSPEITITGKSALSTEWVKQNSTPSNTFAFMPGVGLNVHPTNRISILLNLDYLLANPDFINVNTYSSTGQLVKYAFSQKMETINISLGFGWHF